MKKILAQIIPVIVLVLCAVTTSHAQEPLKGAVANLEKGWQKVDITLLGKTVKSFEEMAKKIPKDHLATYYAAKAHFAIADCLDIKSNKEFDETGEGDKHINAALDMIKTSLTAKENSVNTHILKFQVIRRKMFHVGFPMLMMHVSTRKGAYNRAKELNPSKLDVQIMNVLEIAEASWPTPPPEKPVAEFEIILKKNPNSSEVYYQIGFIWDKAKKVVEARKNYKKALEVNPNHHWAKKKLKGLASGSGA